MLSPGWHMPRLKQGRHLPPWPQADLGPWCPKQEKAERTARGKGSFLQRGAEASQCPEAAIGGHTSLPHRSVPLRGKPCQLSSALISTPSSSCIGP